MRPSLRPQSWRRSSLPSNRILWSANGHGRHGQSACIGGTEVAFSALPVRRSRSAERTVNTREAITNGLEPYSAGKPDAVTKANNQIDDPEPSFDSVELLKFSRGREPGRRFFRRPTPYRG
jgi:hypothetical protein